MSGVKGNPALPPKNADRPPYPYIPKKVAKDAIRQIKQKAYTDKYLHQDKAIVLIGINFSSETKSIEEWLTETLV